MLKTYYAMIAEDADDAAVEAHVDEWLSRCPTGLLAQIELLTYLRDEECHPESCNDSLDGFCGDSPESIKAAIGAAILALRQRAPDAAAKLRALRAVNCRGNLKLGLSVLAHVGPTAAIRAA